jgi:dienelactone hydrolase
VAFSDPDRTAAAMSRDGRHIAYLENRSGVLNLMVCNIDKSQSAISLTRETERSLMPALVWAGTGEHVVIFRDPAGKENYQAFSVSIRDHRELPLTPGGDTRSWCLGYSPRFPTKLLFALNARDQRYFDVICIDAVNGRSEILFENDGFSKLHTDIDLVVRYGERTKADGAIEVFQRLPDGSWSPFLEIPSSDVLTTRLGRLSADGLSLFLLDSRGRDKTALFELNTDSRVSTLLAEDANADIDEIVYQPRTWRPLAAKAVASRQQWHAVARGFLCDLDPLFAEAGDAELDILDIDESGDRLLVSVDRSNAAGEYWVFNISSGTTQKLFKARSDLEGFNLRQMESVLIPATDGLTLRAYITLPNDGFRNGPLVLLIHGGPYDRDRWGYSPLHQWLASRGYCVLSVNFRGSTGFGKQFVNAADREWGGRMQHDLLDGVQWAIERGYADPTRIGALGSSYGGYAALMCAALSPQAFACVLALSAPSNLVTFIGGIPAYWRTWFSSITSRLADPGTPEGRRWLLEQSPLSHVDRIVRPVLIAQGLNDVRVRPQESEQIVRALIAHNIPVTHLTFSDEGHYFARQGNRIALAAVMEAFLTHHLGGLMEPVGNAFTDSTIRFESGRSLIPTLEM